MVVIFGSLSLSQSKFPMLSCILSFYVFPNGLHATNLRTIVLLQQSVVRVISFENFTAPSTPIFSNLKISKLQDLFQLKLLSFVYDCINKISPSYFHSFFELEDSVHRYCTRQANKNNTFLTQRNTLQYGLRSVRYHGAKCWNDIPVAIKNTPSANTFRRKLKPSSLEVSTNFDWRRVDLKRSPTAQSIILIQGIKIEEYEAC